VKQRRLAVAVVFLAILVTARLALRQRGAPAPAAPAPAAAPAAPTAAAPAPAAAPAARAVAPTAAPAPALSAPGAVETPRPPKLTATPRTSREQAPAALPPRALPAATPAQPAATVDVAAAAAPPPAAAAAPSPSPGPAAPPATSTAVETAVETASAPLDPHLSGAVSGAVRDAWGRAIAGATVLAVSADGEDASETITDDDGFYLVAGLKPGRYAVFSGLGTPVASRVAGRGVDVSSGTVARLDLLEPGVGTTVRVTPRDAGGRPTNAQAILVAGAPSAAGAVGSLLASEAIYLPELGTSRTVLLRVPPGVYTLVLLQGRDMPVRAARDPVRIAGEREVDVSVEVAALDVP